MTRCILLSPTDQLSDLRPLGGKGAGLARLLAHGFPVPSTAVVSVDAYRAAVAENELACFLDGVRAGTSDASADEVDAVFVAAPIVGKLRDEILAIAQRVAGGRPLVVRSSATVEDLAAASFAGQYRSFLDVTEPDEILRAIKLVWASLWHPAPRAYRRAHGLPDDAIGMAVVLMRMVPAVRAGVAFTIDPGGLGDSVRVESVEGLADALVAGAVTPDSWTVPRLDPRATLAVAPPPVADVASLALEIENAFGEPQDVEWAWDGVSLWVVQARPITARAERGDGFDTPVDRAELTTAGIAETLPGTLPPLIWQVSSYCLEEALRRVLDDVGAVVADDVGAPGFIRRVRGRAALDLDRLKEAARSLPTGAASELEREYFGNDSAALPDGAVGAATTASWRALWQDLRVITARRRAVHEAETVVVAASEIVAARPDLSRLGAAGLLGYRDRLIDLGARAMAAELGVAAGAVASYARLEHMLGRHLDAAAARHWAQQVTTGTGVVAVASDASMAVFAGPAWVETGTPAPNVTSTGTSAGATQALADLEAKLAGSRRWRRTRVLTGQLVDVRLHMLRRLAADASAMLGRRGRTKAAFLAIGGEVRRVHLALGQQLTLSGALPDAADVDLLSDAELRSETAPPAPVELHRRRRWLRRYADDGPLPERFRGLPGPEQRSVASGSILDGIAVSGGRYTGSARLVRGPDERLPAGDVLVAESTDASWLPLFLDAGAVVVARGGPLSHAAIVARELGLPAVLGVSAVATLDGKTVTVDGDQGVVTLHTATSAAAPAEIGAATR